MNTYSNVGPRSTQTPQTEPIPGSKQQPNNAGGFGFVVDDKMRLTRFLILGSQGGTYYVKERELTKQNLEVVERLLQQHRGKEVVDTIIEVSEQGRAISNDPALFALACCTNADDLDVRQYALSALPRVARTGTHLLHFVHFVKQFRGWGRAYKRAIAEWYQAKSVAQLAYQVVKYQQRDGYAQSDLLRLSHPKTRDEERNALYRWIVDGVRPELPVRVEIINTQDTQQEEEHAYAPATHPLALVWAYEQAKRATSEQEVVQLITRYRLPREAVPTEYLTSPRVWEALLEDMPLEAMTRNLATMTRIDLLKMAGKPTRTVVARLTNREAVHKARLHPLKLLAALKTYESGRGERGSNTWTPIPKIVDALDTAFYLAFKNVEPSNKRLLLALDVSGSMSIPVSGIPHVSAREAAAAMALVTAAVEPSHQMMAFSHKFVPFDISPDQRLSDVVKTMLKTPFGRTDCALPMVWAKNQKVEIDAFLVYTDSETWFGDIHPVQALRQYREQMGIPAKLVVVGMVSNHISIADPDDGGMLDVVGFDTNTPQVITEFLRH
jgi:60 kDa SS-A/Ro ribonucleoprotein